MKPFTSYIFDLDGVLYRDQEIMPDGPETVRAIAERGSSVFYLTNNSGLHRESYVEKLTNMGYPTQKDQVMTSAYGTALYLKSIGAAGKTAYVVGGDGLKQELSEIGLEILNFDQTLSADFVIAGIDRQFTYHKLLVAQNAIMSRATFIATNRDPTFPIKDGKVNPGGGSIVAAIETASLVTGKTIGKPEPYLYQLLLEQNKIQPNESLAIGDRLDTDILGGKRAGLTTALVLTGVTTKQEAIDAEIECKPDYIIATINELL
jgi:4-nitrophenyl phosphatase